MYWETVSSINVKFSLIFQVMLIYDEKSMISVLLLFLITMDWIRILRLLGSLLELLVTLKFYLVNKNHKNKNGQIKSTEQGWVGILDSEVIWKHGKLWKLGLDPQGGVRNQLVLLVLGFWCSQAYIVSLLSISSSFSITLVVIASFFVICA